MGTRSNNRNSFWQAVNAINAVGEGFASGVYHSVKSTVKGGIGLVKRTLHFAKNPVSTTSDMIESGVNLSSGIKLILP